MMDYNAPSLPRSLLVLIAVTTAVWVVQLIPGIGPAVTIWLCHVPSMTFEHGQLWRLFTYIFLHDPKEPYHILFNMICLWMFGGIFVNLWGTFRFIVFYILSGAGAGLFSLVFFFSPFWWNAPVIGASGALLALFTVFALKYPREQVLFFFFIPMNAVAAVAICGLISLLGSILPQGNIANLTHLGGIVVGLLFVKGVPVFNNFIENAKAGVENAKRNAEQRQKTKDAEYYERVIDPILKKISERGMDSLTPEEKRLLEEPSRRKMKAQDDSGKILPFKRHD